MFYSYSKPKKKVEEEYIIPPTTGVGVLSCSPNITTPWLFISKGLLLSEYDEVITNGLTVVSPSIITWLLKVEVPITYSEPDISAEPVNGNADGSSKLKVVESAFSNTIKLWEIEAVISKDPVSMLSADPGQEKGCQVREGVNTKGGLASIFSALNSWFDSET